MFRFKFIPMTAVLCCLSALTGVSSSNAQSGPPNLLGMRLSDAEKTDFFSWFHLREIDRHKDGGGQTIVVFKPEGESVRGFVTVAVTLNGQDKITSMELDISRAFADDGRATGPLARDISKSLLLAALPESDRDTIRDLIAAIGSPAPNSHTIVITKEPGRQPDPQTPGYQAFLGNQSQYAKSLSGSVVIIENIEQNSEALLRITVSAK
jgi:hypothetical protein